MLLNLSVYDAAGTSRGAVRMKLDFGQNQWTVEDDKQPAWQGVGYSGKGTFELKPWGVMWVWDQVPGIEKQNTIIFWNPPVSEDDSRLLVGHARLFAPKDSAFKEGRITWSINTVASAAAPATPSVSPARAKMLALLEKVPKTGLSSNDPLFKDYTGFDTARLKKDYWDVEFVKKDPKDTSPNPVMIPNPSRNFTTCNAFLGNMAGRLGAKAGSWLARGPLLLSNVDKDVPGSWVPIDKTGVKRFRPGDFFSQRDGAQVFGHVGIVGSLDGDNWTSIDGGQGGRRGGIDYIKWVPRGKFDPTVINGWCDISIYFGDEPAAKK